MPDRTDEYNIGLFQNLLKKQMLLKMSSQIELSLKKYLSKITKNLKNVLV